MKRVFSVLQRVMQNPVTVHLHGETGTGKDLVAQALHFNSPRRDGNFVALNCGAVSQSLLESELFGHAKGAFTGADRDHVGMIERAHEGTLFLDEIGEIPHNLQVSLLRMLQEAKIRRVGESFDRDVDVRIITATHRDLDTELREGRMRQDFFYRINVVTIHLPPLRERDEDILLLAEHFLGIQREKLDRAGLEFSGGAKRAMLKYEWPGNVRELMNRIERASALAETDVIGPSELTLDRSVTEAPDTPRNGALKDILREVEVRVIEQALEESDYVMARAAKKLGMTRQNLYARIRRHGVRTAREIG
jgi:DNA-binding NtrC family response regulator